jgi:hypothetical protein
MFPIRLDGFGVVTNAVTISNYPFKDFRISSMVLPILKEAVAPCF